MGQEAVRLQLTFWEIKRTFRLHLPKWRKAKWVTGLSDLQRAMKEVNVPFDCYIVQISHDSGMGLARQNYSRVAKLYIYCAQRSRNEKYSTRRNSKQWRKRRMINI